MHDMSQAVRDNFAEKAAYVARSLPGMAVRDDADFVAVDCGLPSDTFNVVVARNLLRPQRLLTEAVGHFMAAGVPMALWYWEDQADRQGMAALTAYGLTHAETAVAMVADLHQTSHSVPQPDGLTISYADDADQLRAYGAVISRLFGASDEGRAVAAYFDLLSAHADTFPALRHYIGTYRGQVVATGCLFLGSGSVGIYDIVTEASYRRRGIGAAMFARLVSEARRAQQRYAVLQASPDGIGIYQRLGFAAVGTVHIFENRALLSGHEARGIRL